MASDAHFQRKSVDEIEFSFITDCWPLNDERTVEKCWKLPGSLTGTLQLYGSRWNCRDNWGFQQKGKALGKCIHGVTAESLQAVFYRSVQYRFEYHQSAVTVLIIKRDGFQGWFKTY